MKRGIAALSATIIFSLFSGPGFAAYCGWVAGGASVYGTVADTPAAARQQAIDICTESEAVPCQGAFVLGVGTRVVTAHCVSGELSGFAIGETRQSVEAKIANSAFDISECTLGE